MDGVTVGWSFLQVVKFPQSVSIHQRSVRILSITDVIESLQ
jgi:hypothetical protein